MSMLEYYDRDGSVLTQEQWIAKWTSDDYKRIAYAVVESKNGVMLRVSTVWLGTDHSFTLEGPPIIFETMVFPMENHSDMLCERYATEEEAIKGHQEAIDWAKQEDVGDVEQ